MIILGVESSATPCSCAVMQDGEIIAELYSNNGLTHSVTLLPQIDETLKKAEISLNDVDIFAVSNGPGSFTGLRIGAATIKGLCAEDKRCLGVSTLLAMAYNHADFDGVICPCMDARCNQFYNALFCFEDGKIKRLCEDRAIMSDELVNELKNIKKSILLVGDGANLCYNRIKEADSSLLEFVELKKGEEVYQRASGVCLAASESLRAGKEPVSKDDLNLMYLRLPQAERELKKKEIKK